MCCLGEVTDGQIGLAGNRHELRVPVAAAELRLQHFEGACGGAQAQISRGKETLCIRQVGRPFQCSPQIILGLIELPGAKLDFTGEQQTRHVLRRTLQDLLDRFASPWKVASLGRYERIEVVRADVLFRHLSDGANLRARLLEFALGDQQ